MDAPDAEVAGEERAGLPVLAFAASADWETWLVAHATSRGAWLKLAKKGSGFPSLSYAEAVDVALCHGWIDGQAGAYDASWWLQRFTPRGPRSAWSQINRDKVLVLTAAGRMRPAGLAAVEAAQRDGRWERAYAPPSTATVPAGLQAALDASPAAAAFFATLGRSSRYAVLHRVQEARRAETRARRIAGFVEMLARQEKPR